MKLAGWAASSANPEEVSMRVKGIVLSLSSVIILIAAQLFQVTLTPDDVVAFATEAGAIVGAIATIYGAGLALLRRFAKKPN